MSRVKAENIPRVYSFESEALSALYTSVATGEKVECSVEAFVLKGIVSFLVRDQLVSRSRHWFIFGEPSAKILRLVSEVREVSESFKSVTTEAIEVVALMESIEREWPEVARIVYKLKSGKVLDERDEMWVKELAEATRWSREDVIEDLTEIDSDPSERAEKYRKLYRKYFREAVEFKEKGDDRQASEKLWGAIVALIKFYAAKKNVPIVHWSRGKLEHFITNSIKPQHRKLFRDLLDKGQTLHEHFYEGHLDKTTFEERWNELIELLKKSIDIVKL